MEAMGRLRTVVGKERAGQRSVGETEAFVVCKEMIVEVMECARKAIEQEQSVHGTGKGSFCIFLL
jgi:hypothetical protein